MHRSLIVAVVVALLGITAAAIWMPTPKPPPPAQAQLPTKPDEYAIAARAMSDELLKIEALLAVGGSRQQYSDLLQSVEFASRKLDQATAGWRRSYLELNRAKEAYRLARGYWDLIIDVGTTGCIVEYETARNEFWLTARNANADALKALESGD